MKEARLKLGAINQNRARNLTERHLGQGRWTRKRVVLLKRILKESFWERKLSEERDDLQLIRSFL